MFKRVQSRDELIEYALRSNGAPVIQINVAQEQLEDRVNDALHMFFRYHMDASVSDVITVKVTQADKDQGALTLPKEVISVKDMVYTTSTAFTSSTNTTNNLQYQMYFSDLISRTFAGNGYGISSYVITKSYLGTLASVMGNVYNISNFQLHGNKVKIIQDWDLINVGDYVGLDVQKVLNPEELPDIYDDYWLKKYTSALVKKQWGENLMKYNIPALVGGASINGIDMFNAALEEIQKLEDRLTNEFQFPVMGFMA